MEHLRTLRTTHRPFELRTYRDYGCHPPTYTIHEATTYSRATKYPVLKEVDHHPHLVWVSRPGTLAATAALTSGTVEEHASDIDYSITKGRNGTTWAGGRAGGREVGNRTASSLDRLPIFSFDRFRQYLNVVCSQVDMQTTAHNL